MAFSESQTGEVSPKRPEIKGNSIHRRPDNSGVNKMTMIMSNNIQKKQGSSWGGKYAADMSNWKPMETGQ